MKYFGLTDRGRLRKTNQDSYTIASNRAGDVFAVVCDGIGGGKGGDIASRLAVTHFSMAFSNNEGFKDDQQVKRWLEIEIPAANEEIFRTGQRTPELKGMGTTLTGVMITSVGRFVINVGDSRTYAYYADDTMKVLTTDHTLVNDMLRHGELTPEEAKNYPRKNVLTNALGVWEKSRFDVERHDEAVNGFLICSDGLHGYVDEEVIRSIVLNRMMDPALRVRRLYAEAMNAGGFDNITAILIDLEGDETYGR
ncbi:MAG: Stp1/IreP family PP2C-type Ser/Thr phosphatase [Solobacterium sp.]|nr:Stp1/IreP family PP2C-type Ser/Thr phosphatase [Solobacterium sp.]